METLLEVLLGSPVGLLLLGGLLLALLLRSTPRQAPTVVYVSTDQQERYEGTGCLPLLLLLLVLLLAVAVL